MQEALPKTGPIGYSSSTTPKKVIGLCFPGAGKPTVTFAIKQHAARQTESSAGPHPPRGKYTHTWWEMPRNGHILLPTDATRRSAQSALCTAPD